MRSAAWQVLWFLLTWPVSSSAQTTLYLLLKAEPFETCPPVCPPESGALIEIDVDVGRISSVTPIRNARGTVQQLGVTPDGRYVTWTGTEPRVPGWLVGSVDALTVFDRLTHVSAEVFRSPPPSYQFPLGTKSLLMHPRRDEVLVRFADPPVLAMTPTGIRAVQAGCTSPILGDITRDGRTVVLHCPGAGVIVDVDSGLELHRVPAPAFQTPDVVWPFNGDGTEVFRASRSNVPLINRFNVTTGSVLAERMLDDLDAVGRLHTDPRTGRLFAELANGLLVLAPDTLETLARIPSGLAPHVGCGVGGSSTLFDRDRPQAYMLSECGRPPDLPSPDPREVRIDVIDTDSLTVIGGATMWSTAPIGGFAIVPLPPRPVALVANVHGSHVTLQWAPGTEPGAATNYRVEVSLSPGGPSAVLETPLTAIAGAVPDGAYYVRVRGVNVGGLGPPSEEIFVHVPQ